MTSVRVLVPLSGLFVAGSLALGLRASAWLAELLIVVAMAEGLVAGLALPWFWGRSGGPSAAEASVEKTATLVARLAGPAGRYLLFLLSVAFAAVEGHAVGVGIASGAPVAVLVLLVPPLVIGALALRGALGIEKEPRTRRV